jgi:hypothetical protein
MAAASATNIIDFGEGNAVICKFTALILHSPIKCARKSYHGNGILSSGDKVCIETHLR